METKILLINHNNTYIMSTKTIIGIIIGALAIVATISLVSWLTTIRQTAINTETQLNAQYLDNQNYLSSYISGFYEQFDVLQIQSDKLNSILQDAVAGRYDKGGFSADGALFSAVVEAYPEASAATLLSNWGKAQDYIASQREGYRNKQTKLLDLLRAYDSYRWEKWYREFALWVMRFPSKKLEARIGSEVTRGDEAREQMYRIVVTSDVIEAYKSGEMEPLQMQR
jgi:hypothetical protein